MEPPYILHAFRQGLAPGPGLLAQITQGCQALVLAEGDVVGHGGKGGACPPLELLSALSPAEGCVHMRCGKHILATTQRGSGQSLRERHSIGVSALDALGLTPPRPPAPKPTSTQPVTLTAPARPSALPVAAPVPLPEPTEPRGGFPPSVVPVAQPPPAQDAAKFGFAPQQAPKRPLQGPENPPAKRQRPTVVAHSTRTSPPRPPRGPSPPRPPVSGSRGRGYNAIDDVTSKVTKAVLKGRSAKGRGGYVPPRRIQPQEEEGWEEPEPAAAPPPQSDFMSARVKLRDDYVKEGKMDEARKLDETKPREKTLGCKRRQNQNGNGAKKGEQKEKKPSAEPESTFPEWLLEEDGSVPEELENVDPALVTLICSEMVDRDLNITFDDIAGLDFAKKCVEEAVVWPMMRPDLFTGLRGPPRGLLLFGPPGTGKTLIGKAIASVSGSKFFSISASSLMSKWIGEGEKMVKVLFAVATVVQPSVVFIDEIDSLLTSRSEGENDAMRRMKTEFLVQLDGAGKLKDDDRILIIGATNRPWELDDAARRRLSKRLYIPLPDVPARTQMITHALKGVTHGLDAAGMEKVVEKSDGFSGSDMRNLCKEASMNPLRECGNILQVNEQDVRPMNISDFRKAFRQVRASVVAKDLVVLAEWNEKFGSFGSNGKEKGADGADLDDGDDDW